MTAASAAASVVVIVGGEELIDLLIHGYSINRLNASKFQLLINQWFSAFVVFCSIFSLLRFT